MTTERDKLTEAIHKWVASDWDARESHAFLADAIIAFIAASNAAHVCPFSIATCGARSLCLACQMIAARERGPVGYPRMLDESAASKAAEPAPRVMATVYDRPSQGARADDEREMASALIASQREPAPAAKPEAAGALVDVPYLTPTIVSVLPGEPLEERVFTFQGPGNVLRSRAYVRKDVADREAAELRRLASIWEERAKASVASVLVRVAERDAALADLAEAWRWIEYARKAYANRLFIERGLYEQRDAYRRELDTTLARVAALEALLAQSARIAELEGRQAAELRRQVDWANDRASRSEAMCDAALARVAELEAALQAQTTAHALAVDREAAIELDRRAFAIRVIEACSNWLRDAPAWESSPRELRDDIDRIVASVLAPPAAVQAEAGKCKQCGEGPHKHCPPTQADLSAPGAAEVYSQATAFAGSKIGGGKAGLT